MSVMKGAFGWTAPKLLQLLFNFIMQLFYFYFVYEMALKNGSSYSNLQGTFNILWMRQDDSCMKNTL